MIVFVVTANGTNTTIAQIGHLPPSAKLVYKVLESEGLLTQKDLIRETSLPSRTVRYALARLREEKILVERYYFTDARQSLYGLALKKQEVVAV
ncbi:MAG: winged helix-turn-helix transcriptional regulator [Methanoregula sp.]|nr:winged helix-turn-helix transcriptional regulator [Methanoregula sp.]